MAIKLSKTSRESLLVPLPRYLRWSLIKLPKKVAQVQGIHPTPPSTTKIQIQLQKYKYTRWSRKCRDPTTSPINPFSSSSSGVFLLQRIQVHNVTDLCGQLENSGHTLSCSHVTDRYIFDIFQHHNYGFFSQPIAEYVRFLCFSFQIFHTLLKNVTFFKNGCFQTSFSENKRFAIRTCIEN